MVLVTIRLSRAADDDLPAVQALLDDAALPTAGLMEVPTSLFVLRDGDEMVGAAALERHGGDGLVRSVVVAAGRRGAGLGRLLVDAVEDEAAVLGLATLYLLTETAAPFFARRGYAAMDRGSAPAAVAAAVEWSVACGDTAVAMRKGLRPLRQSANR